MKKIISLIFIVLLASPVFAQENQKREPFFSSLTLLAPNESIYTFMVDLYIQEHCKEIWSVEEISSVSKNYIYVLTNLKNGNYEQAKQSIKQIKCKKNQ